MVLLFALFSSMKATKPLADDCLYGGSILSFELDTSRKQFALQSWKRKTSTCPNAPGTPCPDFEGWVACSGAPSPLIWAHRTQ
jgi:hypothetical protein